MRSCPVLAVHMVVALRGAGARTPSPAFRNMHYRRACIRRGKVILFLFVVEKYIYWRLRHAPYRQQGFSIPGTVSSEFKKADLHAWRQGFYERLAAHAERAAATVAAAEAATTAKESAICPDSTSQDIPPEDAISTINPNDLVTSGCPKIVAFAGKRQVSVRTASYKCRLSTGTRFGRQSKYEYPYIASA